MFDIKENLKKLPTCPGVYMHKDSLGKVIYVGKAKNLKNRVRQYFQSYGQSTAKLKALVSNIAEFEYISCTTEMEALILECNLIKKYQPKYNVLLRDDKTYPYIMISMEEDFPRLVKTRLVRKDGNRYFGPYSDANAVNQSIELLNSIFKLKRCKAVAFPKDFRACLNLHIDECQGPCQGNVSKEEYGRKINEVIDILNGKKQALDKVFAKLEEEMLKASENLDFEKAAKLRDNINSLKELQEHQTVTILSARDMDIIIPLITSRSVSVALFPVRDGKLSGREIYHMDSEGDNDRVELVESFIKQYYTQWALPPSEILLDIDIYNSRELEEFLSDGGHQVNIHKPLRGDKKALLDLAIKDSLELIKTLDEKIIAKEEKEKAIKEKLDIIVSAAGYDICDSRYRVEAYDISNTNGVDSVAGMVVFEGLKAVKKDYRRFKIKSVSGPDDYVSLKEVILRRFKRAKEESAGFETYPDIILMDGGIGQVHSAMSALKELDLDIMVLGMAKDDHHRTRALVNDDIEINLKDYPIVYSYIGNIQEEVHRFAISYHHNLHNKKSINSILEEIDGIGEAKRNILLKHFHSVEGVKNASLEELESLEGISKSNAQNIFEFFKNIS
ncbi:MAG: excinuclease ABC subunit UvrC [Clostridia bacterium]|nr:excinuclease ABC subunit UvrC [Clostridia bacterium]